MKRKFVTNLAILLLLNLIVKPIYAFGIDVGVQNTVGAENYGSYFILLNFSLIFQILLDLGIDNFTRRDISRHHQLLTKYFSYILPLKLVLGLIYFILCSIIGLIMGWQANEFKLLLILLTNQFLAGCILYFRANLGGMHMFKADSIISVIDRFIVIVICGSLLLNPTTHRLFRIEWLVYAQFAAYLIVATITFCMVLRKAGNIHFKIDLRYYRAFLRQSLPYAMLILLMATYFRIDSILIDKLLDDGKVQAGIYAQSFRIIEIFANYGYLFTIILLPIFSKMIKQGDSVENLTRLSFTLLFVPAVIIAFGCFGYRYEIIDVLYKEHVQGSAKVLGILIFSFPGMCITYIFGTLLTANGKMFQLNTMAAVAVAFNLLMNILLINKFGIIGAAIANMATQLLTSIYQVNLSKRIFGFHSDHSFLIRLIVFIVFIAIAGILFREIPVYWIYSLGLYLLFAFTLSFILRLLDVRSVLKLLLSE